MMRLRRRFLPEEVGASPSFTFFCARGGGSAGLGSGEISSTSATGGSCGAALDLRGGGSGGGEEEEEKQEEEEELSVGGQ